MNSFFNLDIPSFPSKISEVEYDKWHRIQTHLNVFGPYGRVVNGKVIPAGNEETFTLRYKQKIKIVIPYKLIQHFLYGKTLLFSGLIGNGMTNFDIQICGNDLSNLNSLLSQYNIYTYKINNKHYLSIDLDTDCPVWETLEMFVYKVSKVFHVDLAIRGKPAYLKTTVDSNGEHWYKIIYDSNLIELDSSLLKDSVFEKFMQRKKTLISSLVDFVSDVPENYAQLDFADFAANYDTETVKVVWDSPEECGGETIKPLINTQPERILESVEPSSRPLGGDSSDEASESEHTSKYNSLVESASSETLSAEEPAAPSRPAVLSDLDEKSLVSNISFIVSPPPKWQAMVQQLTFIYKSGTNAVERFCYKQYIEGGKKAKLRKRYITKDKFISYAIAIINSCWFSKNNCQTIKYMKLIFKGLNTNVKWDNHDFYYVLDILLLIGIINKVTNSYKVGSYGKQYEFVRGSLSRFCSEGIYFEFPVL
jgi:hypothetical protein